MAQGTKMVLVMEWLVLMALLGVIIIFAKSIYRNQ